MSIDKSPAVGRFVFRESYLRHGFCRLAGVITKVSGSRVYFKDKHQETFLSKDSIAAICDTPEECEQLKRFEDVSLAEIYSFIEKQKEAFALLVKEAV